MDYNHTKSGQGRSRFLERRRLSIHYLCPYGGRWFSSASGEEARGPQWLKLTHRMEILLLRMYYYQPATHSHCVSRALWKWSCNLPSRVTGQIQVKQCREGVLSACGPCRGLVLLPLDRWGDKVQARRKTKGNRGSENVRAADTGCPGDCPKTSPTISASHFMGLLACVPEHLLEFSTEKPDF